MQMLEQMTFQPATEAINSTAQDNVQVEMLKMLREIKQDSHRGNNTKNDNGNNQNRAPQREELKKTPDNAT